MDQEHDTWLNMSLNMYIHVIYHKQHHKHHKHPQTQLQRQHDQHPGGGGICERTARDQEHEDAAPANVYLFVCVYDPLLLDVPCGGALSQLPTDDLTGDGAKGRCSCMTQEQPGVGENMLNASQQCRVQGYVLCRWATSLAMVPRVDAGGQTQQWGESARQHVANAS